MGFRAGGTASSQETRHDQLSPNIKSVTRSRTPGEPPNLYRRQHRKPLSLAPQIQRIGTCGFVLKGLNAGRRRAPPAQPNHVRHDVRRPRKQRLDPALPAIAHPALKSVRPRPVLDPGAVADALHPAPDRPLTEPA